MYPFSHNHGVENDLIFEKTTSGGEPFSTSMIVGGREKGCSLWKFEIWHFFVPTWSFYWHFIPVAECGGGISSSVFPSGVVENSTPARIYVRQSAVEWSEESWREVAFLGGGFDFIVFSSWFMWRWSNLTSTFFNWVGSTTNSFFFPKVWWMWWPIQWWMSYVSWLHFGVIELEDHTEEATLWGRYCGIPSP